MDGREYEMGASIRWGLVWAWAWGGREQKHGLGARAGVGVGESAKVSALLYAARA